MKSLLVTLSLLTIGSPSIAQTLGSLTDQRNYYQAELEKTESSMFSYILDHKLATAAIIATGGGLGAFLEENMDDDTRVAVMLFGFIGIAYCLNDSENAKECAAVTAELVSYAAVVGNLKSKIDLINDRINLLERPAPQLSERPAGRTVVDAYYVNCLINGVNGKINYSYRWENDHEWVDNSVDQGAAVWHGHRQKQKFYIMFDNSYLDGYQAKTYYLESVWTASACSGGKRYEFYLTGSTIDMRPIN